MKHWLLLPAASCQTFLGFKLPELVNLNIELDRTGQARTMARESDFYRIEKEVVGKSLLRMREIPCDAKKPIYKAFNLCGASVSAGEFIHVSIVPQNLQFLLTREAHSASVPLASVLDFAAGGIPGERDGVDFAALFTQYPPTCAVVSLPEYSIARHKPLPGASEFDGYRAFLDEWEKIFAAVGAIRYANSTSLGRVALYEKHRRSIAQTLKGVVSPLSELHGKGCRLRFKLITVACKEIDTFVLYGRKNKITDYLRVEYKELILLNAGTHGYFSVLARCTFGQNH